MELARRVASLAPSATLAVGATAARLRSEGVDVISFAAGEPDFGTPEPIRRACERALGAGKTKYPPVPGDPATRERIARKLREENGVPGVTADHVVITSGGKQAIHHVLHALFDEGHERPGELILPEPAWVSYRPIARLAGATVVSLPTDAARDFRVDPGALEAAITERTRLLIINSPSNPCGTMMDEADLRAIAAVVARHPHVLVLTDDIYEKLVFGGQAFFSIAGVPEIADRVITINGLSKAYAMTGWRIGYLAGSGETGLAIAAACKKLQSQSTTGIPTFFFDAIRAALDECADEVASMRDAFARRASLMHARLVSIGGVACPAPAGAFYCFPDFSAFVGRAAPDGTRITDGSSFAQALLTNNHVACVPGPPFGAGGERACRFTFACSDEQIEAGMDRLDAFVSSLS